MENKTITNNLKGVALFLSWLTLSPLLFILDGRWKLLPKWLCIVLFVLLPIMLVGMARQTAIAPSGATD